MTLNPNTSNATGMNMNIHQVNDFQPDDSPATTVDVTITSPTKRF